MAGRTATASTSERPDTTQKIEKSVVAFAEQLGRFVGTVQGKAEGWMNRESLREQIVAVRDSAGQLLEKVSGDSDQPPAARRSRGAVDAPGKKHRGPVPADPRAKSAARRPSQMRRANAGAKAKARGRG